VAACYDCHSNQTRWPLYSRVAPMSWLVTRDVQRGRDKLNFSTWEGSGGGDGGGMTAAARAAEAGGAFAASAPRRPSPRAGQLGR
jgi:Haem-binding domain